MSHIYHGSFKKKNGGTNRIIANKEACIVPSSVPFWKYIEDIPGGKTRSQYKKE